LARRFHPAESPAARTFFINGSHASVFNQRGDSAGGSTKIVEFAELQEFIDAPREALLLRHVHARLGFARRDSRGSGCAAGRRGVGRCDEGFTHKCPRQVLGVQAARQDDSPGDALARPRRAFCDEAVWLDAGRKKAEGDPRRA
jgi:ABC-type polysaccharide/polyol phosphate transport system ATPase subunit